MSGKTGDTPTAVNEATPQVIVSEEKKSRFGFAKRRLPSSKKGKIATIIVALLIIGLIAFGVWWLLNSQNKTASYPVICSEETISSANEYINTNNIEAFSELRPEILDKKDYEKDPNCVYALVRYNIMTGNKHEGIYHFKQLNKLNDTNGQIIYNEAYEPEPLSIKSISSILQSLQDNEQTFNEKNKQMNSNLNEIDEMGQ